MKRILVALDGSPLAETILPFVEELAEEQAGRDAAGRVEARGRIMLITDYLSRIQEK